MRHSLGRSLGVATAIIGLTAGLASVAFAAPDQGSIARGGKLYDKW